MKLLCNRTQIKLKASQKWLDDLWFDQYFTIFKGWLVSEPLITKHYRFPSRPKTWEQYLKRNRYSHRLPFYGFWGFDNLLYFSRVLKVYVYARISEIRTKSWSRRSQIPNSIRQIAVENPISVLYLANRRLILRRFTSFFIKLISNVW